MVSGITQDPYSIAVSLNLSSFTNLKIGRPLRLTELPTRPVAILLSRKPSHPTTHPHPTLAHSPCLIPMPLMLSHPTPSRTA